MHVYLVEKEWNFKFFTTINIQYLIPLFIPIMQMFVSDEQIISNKIKINNVLYPIKKKKEFPFFFFANQNEHL